MLILTRHRGFSLLELMIVVAIVGILATIAYPSYQNSVRKTNRDDAKAALVQLASAMERRYTTQTPMTYAGTTQADGVTPLATFFESSTPLGSNRTIYNLRITAANQNSFTVQAIAAPGAIVDPNCATLTLTNTGTKTPADCWN